MRGSAEDLPHPYRVHVALRAFSTQGVALGYPANAPSGRPHRRLRLDLDAPQFVPREEARADRVTRWRVPREEAAGFATRMKQTELSCQRPVGATPSALEIGSGHITSRTA